MWKDTNHFQKLWPPRTSGYIQQVKYAKQTFFSMKCLLISCQKFLLASRASRNKKTVALREMQLPWRAGEWQHRTLLM